MDRLLPASTRNHICTVNYLFAKGRVVGPNPIFRSNISLNILLFYSTFD